MIDVSPLIQRAADARERALINRLVGECVGETLTPDMAYRAIVRLVELRQFVAEVSKQQQRIERPAERTAHE